jgi:NADH:ubiquinone oxidoreductase subunit E
MSATAIDTPPSSVAHDVAVLDLGLLEPIFARYPCEEASLMHVLQDTQQLYGYLPVAALQHIAQALGVPLAKVYGVATFYRAFSFVPQGQVVVKVCTGTACHLHGAPQLQDELERRFHVQPGETTPDLALTVKTVNCVGACAMAPVLVINDSYVGHAQAKKIAHYVKDAKK